MLIQYLFSQPSLFIPWFAAMIYGITVHEFAHAWAASWQGDNTAKMMGRLTLNPLAHLDVFGTLFLLIAGFGWGKPVPINSLNFRNKKLGENIVSLAGIFTNLLSVIIFSIVFKIIFPGVNPVLLFLGAYTGFSLLAFFLSSLIILNLVLAFFNLIPVPPLDGSHVLFNLLPDSYNNFKYQLAKNGPIILLGLILLDNFTNIGIFSGIYNFFLNLLSRFF